MPKARRCGQVGRQIGSNSPASSVAAMSLTQPSGPYRLAYSWVTSVAVIVSGVAHRSEMISVSRVRIVVSEGSNDLLPSDAVTGGHTQPRRFNISSFVRQTAAFCLAI